MCVNLLKLVVLLGTMLGLWRITTRQLGTRRFSDNMLVRMFCFSVFGFGSVLGHMDHMANPYSSRSCAPFVGIMVGELWGRGLGVRSGLARGSSGW